MAKTIGISLGTTNSVVAAIEGSTPKVLINSSGSRLTPSVVGFTDKGEQLVGEIARHQQATNPENTVFSIKRFMGRRRSEVAAEELIVPYKITGGPNELVKVNVRGKEYTPPEMSAMILQDLKKTAEDYLGEKVTNAVITVPAYFNDSQRQATKDAGKIAGLEVERIINEPTAAALAYGLEKKKNEKVAVFDFGGGTFDISILDIGDNVFEVLSTNGDTHLGGDDLDAVLINYLADEFKKTEGIDLRQDPMAHQQLKEAAETAKCELTTQVESTVNLPFITADASGPKHLQITITRSKFESLMEHVFERLKEPCRKAMSDAKLAPRDIAEVLLVGGSTRILKVQQIAKELFSKEPNKSLDPDEVVAIGAVIQGAMLAGDVSVKDIVLLDVTPLSLGVETLGGVMTKLIERNTTIPASRKEVFSTGVDNQTTVDIHVLQGEYEFARDNRTLGRFQLTDIPPAPRGIPQIEVAFDIDANGILNVSAKDLATGKQQSIVIKSSSALSEEEITRMTQDAESHAGSAGHVARHPADFSAVKDQDGRSGPVEAGHQAKNKITINMEQTHPVAQFFIDVARDEVERNDPSRPIESIDFVISLQIKSVEALVNDGVKLIDLPRQVGTGGRSATVRFGINGYGRDPRPLWGIGKVQQWAWNWLRRQPHCLLFLEDQSAQLLAMLCLGGYSSKKYREFIADFRSERAAEFETIVKSSLQQFMKKYFPTDPNNPFWGVAMAAQIHLEMLFRSVRADSLGIKWWRFWRKDF